MTADTTALILGLGAIAVWAVLELGLDGWVRHAMAKASLDSFRAAKRESEWRDFYEQEALRQIAITARAAEQQHLAAPQSAADYVREHGWKPKAGTHLIQLIDGHWHGKHGRYIRPGTKFGDKTD